MRLYDPHPYPPFRAQLLHNLGRLARKLLPMDRTQQAAAHLAAHEQRYAYAELRRAGHVAVLTPPATAVEQSHAEYLTHLATKMERQGYTVLVVSQPSRRIDLLCILGPNRLAYSSAETDVLLDECPPYVPLNCYVLARHYQQEIF